MACSIYIEVITYRDGYSFIIIDIYSTLHLLLIISLISRFPETM